MDGWLVDVGAAEEHPHINTLACLADPTSRKIAEEEER